MIKTVKLPSDQIVEDQISSLTPTISLRKVGAPAFQEDAVLNPNVQKIMSLTRVYSCILFLVPKQHNKKLQLVNQNNHNKVMTTDMPQEEQEKYELTQIYLFIFSQLPTTLKYRVSGAQCSFLYNYSQVNFSSKYLCCFPLGSCKCLAFTTLFSREQQGSATHGPKSRHLGLSLKNKKRTH